MAALVQCSPSTVHDPRAGVSFAMVRPAVGAQGSQVKHSPRTHKSQHSNSPHRSRVVSESKQQTDIFNITDVQLSERYKFIEEIGYGNWGSVWKCHPKIASKADAWVAVKLVHRSKNPTSSARVRSLWTEFKCIRAIKEGKHPNLINFSSFIITPSYALVSMDFHPRLMPVALPEAKGKSYFRQLISAVDFLHSRMITHNDIKPANILISASDTPVLCDFGFAQLYSSGPPSPSGSRPPSSSQPFFSSLSWGTPEYLSPERAKGIPHDERLSDIWALGVTMYEVIVGRTPFERTESEEFLTREALEVYYARTTTGQFQGDYIISVELESLIHSMVDPDIKTRCFPCGKALFHAFFQPSPRPKRVADGAGASGVRRFDTDSPVKDRPRRTSGKGTPKDSLSPSKRRQTPTRKMQSMSPIKHASKGPVKVRRDKIEPELIGSGSPSLSRGFSPRPLVLAERGANRPFSPSSIMTKSTLTQSRPVTPANSTRGPAKTAQPSPPPASKIPVRSSAAQAPPAQPAFAAASPRRASKYSTPSKKALRSAEKENGSHKQASPAKAASQPRAAPPRVPSKSSLRQARPAAVRSTPPKLPQAAQAAPCKPTSLASPTKARALKLHTQARAVARQEHAADTDRANDEEHEKRLTLTPSSTRSNTMIPIGHRAQNSFSSYSARSASPASSATSPITPPSDTSFLESSWTRKALILQASCKSSSRSPSRASSRATASPSPQFDEALGAAGRPSPVLSGQKKPSLGAKLKLHNLSLKRPPSALSLRRVPSSLSFNPLKSLGRGRAASSAPALSLTDNNSRRAESRMSLASPYNVVEKAAADRSDEGERLAAFSSHIQAIIDARKMTDMLTHASATIVRDPNEDPSAVIDAPIMSPELVRAFSAQVRGELEEERRFKSRQRESYGPQLQRKGSVTLTNRQIQLASRAASLVGERRSTSVKIRASLTPSFVNNSTSCLSEGIDTALESSTSLASAAPDSPATSFKRGHRRVPTAIRNVPSIYLTSSASDSEYEEMSDVDAGCDADESPRFKRVASPPPTPTIVQRGKQLPMWVPATDDSDENGAEDGEPTPQTDARLYQQQLEQSDEEDADVDEPTVVISASPSKEYTRRSNSHNSPFRQHSTRSPPSSHPRPVSRELLQHTSPLKVRPHLPTNFSAPQTVQEIVTAEEYSQYAQPMVYAPTPPALKSAFSVSTSNSISPVHSRQPSSAFSISGGPGSHPRSESRATLFSAKTQRVNFGDDDEGRETPPPSMNLKAHNRQRSSRSLFSLFSNSSSRSLGEMSLASRASAPMGATASARASVSAFSIDTLGGKEEGLVVEVKKGRRAKEREGTQKEGRVRRIWKKLLR